MKKNLLIVIFCLLGASSVGAYDFTAGDFLLRGFGGGSINVIHEDGKSERTPGAGGIFSLDLEYMLTEAWSVSGSIRPMFAPLFVDLGFAAGVKYRFTNNSVPFIPYIGAALNPAALIPINVGRGHFNLGLRALGGCDYFLMRDLAFGIELALEPSYVISGAKYRKFELTVDVLVGLTWRI